MQHYQEQPLKKSSNVSFSGKLFYTYKIYLYFYVYNWEIIATVKLKMVTTDDWMMLKIYQTFFSNWWKIVNCIFLLLNHFYT